MEMYMKAADEFVYSTQQMTMADLEGVRGGALEPPPPPFETKIFYFYGEFSENQEKLLKFLD